MMRRGLIRAGGFVVGAVALLLSLGASGCKGSDSLQEAKIPPLSNAGETWCPERFEVGPNDTCFAIPERANRDTPVLVYLHGMYTGHGSPEEWAAVTTAVHRGFAVVIPRGKRGLCAWRAELKDHFCWPQDPEDTQTIKDLVSEWERVLWQVDALLEGGTHKRYVLGSANGAFFASVLATHALFPGQAYALVNGGAPGWPLVKAKAIPMMLVTGKDAGEDAAKVQELHETLAKATWAHAFCPRAGAANLTNDDVESALRFFKHDADGRLKPKDGTYPCDLRR